MPVFLATLYSHLVLGQFLQCDLSCAFYLSYSFNYLSYSRHWNLFQWWLWILKSECLSHITESVWHQLLLQTMLLTCNYVSATDSWNVTWVTQCCSWVFCGQFQLLDYFSRCRFVNRFLHRSTFHNNHEYTKFYNIFSATATKQTIVSGVGWLRHRHQHNISLSEMALRLRNDLYCVEWGVKFYSLTRDGWWLKLLNQTTLCRNCHLLPWARRCKPRLARWKLSNDFKEVTFSSRLKNKATAECCLG